MDAPKGLPKCNKQKRKRKGKKYCCMDIVVVGAGVAGLTAADLLSKAGTVNLNQESPLIIDYKSHVRGIQTTKIFGDCRVNEMFL